MIVFGTAKGYLILLCDNKLCPSPGYKPMLSGGLPTGGAFSRSWRGQTCDLGPDRIEE